MLERKQKTRSSRSVVARAALLAPLLGLAEIGTAAGADKKPSAALSLRDMVRTKSSGMLSGWVTRYVPSSYVILQMDAGSTTIAANEIVSVSFADRGPEAGADVAARILRESAGPSPQTGTPALPPNTTRGNDPASTGEVKGQIDLGVGPHPNDSAPTAAMPTPGRELEAKGKLVTQRSWVNTKAGTLGRSTTGPDGGTSTQEVSSRRGLVRHAEVAANGDRSSAEVDVFSRSLRRERGSSCATREDPGCNRATSVTVGVDGLGAELSETHVAAVKAPPSAYAVLGLDAGVVGITSDAIRGVAGQFAFGVRGATGARLPTGKGGGWSGLGFDAQLGAAAGQVQVRVSGAAPISVDYRLGSLAAALGYQYLHFGKLDAETLEQGGFGLFLGYRSGINLDLENEDSGPTLSHGPQIALSFPSYNAGTASVSDFTVKGMILPTGDLTLFAVTLGYGF